MNETVKILMAVMIAAALFFILFRFHSCGKQDNPTKYVKGAEESFLSPGKDSSLFLPGETDTLIIRVPYPVYVEVPAGVHHGIDSSNYNMQNENGSVTVTTYPATDSVKILFAPVTLEKIITRIDTLKIFRIDTLKTYRIDTLFVFNTPEFYESWWFGGLATGAAILTTILLSK